jgi:hypothetical protein
MKFNPGRFPQTNLCDKEQRALRGIAQGGAVALALGLRLEKLGLAMQLDEGWVVTQQGHIRLMFENAH